MNKNKHGFIPVLILLVIIVAIALVFAGIFVTKKMHISGSPVEQAVNNFASNKFAGNNLAGNNCTGTGTVTLSVSPMKAEDIGSIIPYGEMTFEHVTPIDHQYFAPTNWNSPRDAYEVRAPANGHIVSIEHRTSDSFAANHGQKTDEY